MKEETKDTIIVTIITILLILLLIAGGVIIAKNVIRNEKVNDRVCTKICERKGTEFIDGDWIKCQCINDGGDIVYFDRR